MRQNASKSLIRVLAAIDQLLAFFEMIVGMEFRRFSAHKERAVSLTPSVKLRANRTKCELSELH